MPHLHGMASLLPWPCTSPSSCFSALWSPFLPNRPLSRNLEAMAGTLPDVHTRCSLVIITRADAPATVLARTHSRSPRHHLARLNAGMPPRHTHTCWPALSLAFTWNRDQDGAFHGRSLSWQRTCTRCRSTVLLHVAAHPSPCTRIPGHRPVHCPRAFFLGDWGNAAA